MIIDWLLLIPAFCAGMVLGAFYFLGLWWTVRQLPNVRVPALWTVLSFLIRTAMALAGFYAVMAGRWENLLACLAGFTLLRLWLVGRLKPASVPAAEPHANRRCLTNQPVNHLANQPDRQ